MRWSEFRLVLHDWVVTKFRVDAWRLDEPNVKPGKPLPPNTQELPPNRAVRHPLSEVSFNTGGYGDTLTVSVLYDIQYRFPKVIPYHQLPITELEILLINRLWQLQKDSGCVLDGGIVRVDCENPILIETTESNGDYLITIKLYITAEFNFEPEPIPAILQPIDLLDEPAPVIDTLEYYGRSRDGSQLYYSGQVQYSNEQE